MCLQSFNSLQHNKFYYYNNNQNARSSFICFFAGLTSDDLDLSLEVCSFILILLMQFNYASFITLNDYLRFENNNITIPYVTQICQLRYKSHSYTNTLTVNGHIIVLWIKYDGICSFLGTILFMTCIHGLFVFDRSRCRCCLLISFLMRCEAKHLCSPSRVFFSYFLSNQYELHLSNNQN